MFKKADKQVKANNESAHKVDQDLIVHNMPNRAKLGSSSMATMTSADAADSGGQKKNVKSVGIIIIVLGIILVGALIYLSYRFIIKPQASNVVPTPASNIQTPAKSDESEIKNDDISTVSTSSVSVSEIISATSTENIDSSATSSNDVINQDETMPEEGAVEENPWTPILDTDGDGLTDDEELVMGTDVSNIDTDQDGYLDLAEIKSGYNPLGAGRLTESRSLTSYKDSLSSFTLLYPSAWSRQTLNNGYTTIISAPDNSLFQISIQDNPKQQKIADWYAETFTSEIDAYGRFKNGSGWEGVMSKDGINFYLTDAKQKNIYVISYIPVINTRLAYLNIYQMIIDNFKIE